MVVHTRFIDEGERGGGGGWRAERKMGRGIEGGGEVKVMENQETNSVSWWYHFVNMDLGLNRKHTAYINIFKTQLEANLNIYSCD